MNRVAGLETEYGCLISEDQAQSQADAWPVKIKNHLFRKCQIGAIDLHYRDYEEPPGNGGFFFEGGRRFFHIGPLENPSPGRLPVLDLVPHANDAGLLLFSGGKKIRVEDKGSFFKKNN